MDEDVTKAILEQPTELNDVPAKPAEEPIQVTPGTTPVRKAKNQSRGFKLEIPYSEYKTKFYNALENARPLKAISMLTDLFGTSEPEADTQPNTAHAIIEAARDVVKQSMYNQKNIIPTTAQNGTGMKPVENTFADKDPQTYQSMLPGANNKVSPQIAQKGQAMPNNMGKLAYSIDPTTGMPIEEDIPMREKLLMAGGTGIGAGLLHRQITHNKAKGILDPIASDYLHMAETGKYDKNHLNLLNQELVERGISTRLHNAGSKGIAQARMDKAVGDLSESLYKSKLKAAIPFALLGASVPFVSDEIGDMF